MMTIMKIPQLLYVGIIGSNTNGMALANVTPAGDDHAAKKRMTNVDEWVSSHNYGYKKIGTYEIPNIPLVGFKLTSNLRTAIHGGSDKWQVEDPRGFVTEISSTNLAELLSHSTVTNGEIQEACVWARLGSANILLNTGCQAYVDAVKNTEVSKSKTNWKDVKLGNRIILQNSIEGVYLGKMGVLERHYWDQSEDETETQNLLQFNNCNLHAILNDTDKIMHLVTSLKVSGIIDTGELSIKECEEAANYAIEKNITVKSHTYFSRLVCLYSMRRITDHTPKIELELVETEAQPAVRSYQKVVLCDYDGGFGEYVVFSNRQLIYEIDKNILGQGSYVPKVTRIETMGRARYTQQQTDASTVSLLKYYELYCTLTTSEGNTIRVRV